MGTRGFLTRRAQELMQQRTFVPHRLESLISGDGRPVEGLRIAVTGASAGIGREASIQLAARGAHVIAIARRDRELADLTATTGGEYRTCDLSDEDAIADLVDDLADARVDVLVNNAGHSIRRSILDSTDRFHDYRRLAQLNYLAPVQLSLGLLPGMVERGRGQLVNVCTWGVLANTFPRFSSYAASKAALAIFGRSVNAERLHPGVVATNVYYPLVRTEMISPTAEYDDVGALSPEEAGSWIVRAVTHQPIEVAPVALRTLLPLMDLVAPPVTDRSIAALT